MLSNMKTYTYNSYQLVVRGMIISLTERKQHHRICGDNDIADRYKKALDLLMKDGTIATMNVNFHNSWFTDMFARVWQDLRLSHEDYEECLVKMFGEKKD